MLCGNLNIEKCKRFHTIGGIQSVYAVIYKFLDDFWEEIVFLKALVNFGEIRNIEDFFFKLEFEVKN